MKKKKIKKFVNKKFKISKKFKVTYATLVKVSSDKCKSCPRGRKT